MNNEIDIFPWNQNFATGIHAIDEQHKRLIGLLNVLVGHLAFQSEAPEVEQVFNELKSYVAIHFAAEEKIWHKHFKGDSWEEWHKDAHVDFVEKIQELRQGDGTKTTEQILEEIVSFLTHWLALHIIEGDMRLAKVVLALPSGISLERAKELANLEMSGATRVLIDTVMSMYDKLANRTVTLSREINRRIKAEAELQIVSAELNRAKDEAIAADQAKSRYLAAMSHEIRTPLSAVLGLAQMGKRESNHPKLQRIFDQMLDSGKLLQGVVNNVLDFSKIEAGKIELDEEAICLERLIEQLRILGKAPAEEKGIRLRITPDENAPAWFQGDMLRLTQVLGNLQANAVKFTEKGEVEIVIKRRGERLVFTVTDTGIGMTPEQVSHLFIPFAQADKSTTRRFGGTGLGLTITKRLLELMKGEIQITSELGVGSRFEISLPLIESTPSQGEAQACPPQNDGERLKGVGILVAEDNEVNRLVLDGMLRQEGATVTSVEDGQRVLDMLQTQGDGGWDVVLTDIQMPRMNGFELAQEVGQRYPGLPVIGLTANALLGDRQRCLDIGMVDYVSKPIDLETLIGAIRLHARSQVASLESPPGVTPIPHSAALAAGDESSSTPDNTRRDIIDWDALFASAKGRKTFVQQLVSAALSSRADVTIKLRKAAEISDYEAIASLAHNLTGMAGSLHARRLNLIGIQTEDAARETLPEAPVLACKLASMADEMLDELRRFR
jgi:hemerythrin-like metal-binding protein